MNETQIIAEQAKTERGRQRAAIQVGVDSFPLPKSGKWRFGRELGGQCQFLLPSSLLGGSRLPSAKELKMARFQGKHVAGIAAKLKAN